MYGNTALTVTVRKTVTFHENKQYFPEHFYS